MREILFRGKSVNDGEWVFGSLVITTLEPVDDAPIKHYHIEDMTIGCFPNEFQSGISETVDPNTVGQFTGLTAHGKKIFEDDIVVICYETDGEDFSETKRVFYDAEDCCWYPMRWEERCERCDYYTEVKSIEVIGNIHNNPELLEVE